MSFQPDFRHILRAAQNKPTSRLPLYEHLIDTSIMETILQVPFAHLYQIDKDSYFYHYCNFFKQMGYDTVSFEATIGAALPGAGALGGHIKGVIQSDEDFNAYPWERVESIYFDKFSADFAALRRNMPEGMMAIGGVGNGTFECVQELVGYMDLCYLRQDNPKLYASLFEKIGDTSKNIWQRFLHEFGDIYCVCRFGDDLGFKSTTLLDPRDIRNHIIPQYQKVIDMVHLAGKPFLLHCCGNIFNIMDDLIAAQIDAKHSNEDQIAPFVQWVDQYGDRIGNFGGIDTDALCQLPKPEISRYIEQIIEQIQRKGGIAFGSGNSIPNYVPVDQYLHMLKTVRQLRGESV